MADQIIQYNEQMVGAGHPTKADTLNRLALVEHNADGTHNKLTQVIDPWVDVRAYGAIGDGSTDDSAAIQAAIDACPTRGGVVFFPYGSAGIYSLASGITVDSKAIHLYSPAPLGVVLRPGSSYAGNLLTVTDTSRLNVGNGQEWTTTKHNGFAMSNLTLEGLSRTNIVHALVFTGDNDDVELKDISIYNFKGAAIRIGDSFSAATTMSMRESTFDNVETKNCGYDSGTASTSHASLDIGRGSSTTTDATNNLYFNRLGIVYPRYIGVRVINENTGAVAHYIRNIHFRDSFFHANASLAGNDSNGDAWSNDNNTIELGGGGGYVRNVVFDNCRLIEHEDATVGCHVQALAQMRWTGGEVDGYGSSYTTRYGFRFTTAEQSSVTGITTHKANGIGNLIDVVSMATNHKVTIGGFSWYDDTLPNPVVTSTSDYDLVEDLDVHDAQYQHPLDAAASTVTNPVPVARIDSRDYLREAFFVTNAALTADDTDYATISIKVYLEDGSLRTTGTTTTKITGGTGDWTAHTPIPLTLPSQKLLLPGDSIEVDIAKSGAGVVVPRGSLIVKMSKTVRYL